MYGYPKKEIVEGLRARYPEGARVELIDTLSPSPASFWSEHPDAPR